jgi:PIN domain nuclease of toxin-antitoxin system
MPSAHAGSFHHKDPFDRMIIAQSLLEGYDLVGRDKIFDRYGVNRIW